METTPSRHNLCAQVVHDLGRRIISGGFQPGGALPQEAVLCRQLGVSRTVVREAVKILAAKGLVETRPKRGTVVRPASHWSYLDPHVLRWQTEGDVDGRQLLHLTELRQAVEPAAARMAALRASEQEIAKIGEACRAMHDSVGDVDAFLDADLCFHVLVLHASGNPFFAPVANVVNSVLLASLRVTNRRAAENVTSVPLHQQVWKAIAARQPERAERAMRVLLCDAATRIERNARGAKTTSAARLPKRRASRLQPAERT